MNVHIANVRKTATKIKPFTEKTWFRLRTSEKQQSDPQKTSTWTTLPTPRRRQGKKPVAAHPVLISLSTFRVPESHLGSGLNVQFGISRCKLVYIGWINKQQGPTVEHREPCTQMVTALPLIPGHDATLASPTARPHLCKWSLC